ncbi:MAG: hypothetical protein IJZ66_03780 [Oscillibacter sp.]|nr:hypothetical protein [Oscillibacter sp.]
MINYRKSYFILFNAISDALEAPDFEQAKSILVDARLEAMELHLSFDPEEAAKDCREEAERLRDALVDYVDTCPEERIDVRRIDQLLEAIDQADEFCRQCQAQP